MKLRLERLERTPEYTIGRLFVDGVFECWTLEDPVREGPKVPGSTAIPEGTFVLLLDFSHRFQKVMPHVLDVPGFAGIRIHAGNTVADTEGCVLVGKELAVPRVQRRRDAFKALMVKQTDASERQEHTTLEVTHKEAA